MATSKVGSKVSQSVKDLCRQKTYSVKNNKKAKQQNSYTLINQETGSDLSVFESTVICECSKNQNNLLEPILLVGAITPSALVNIVDSTDGVESTTFEAKANDLNKI